MSAHTPEVAPAVPGIRHERPVHSRLFVHAGFVPVPVLPPLQRPVAWSHEPVVHPVPMQPCAQTVPVHVPTGGLHSWSDPHERGSHAFVWKLH